METYDCCAGMAVERLVMISSPGSKMPRGKCSALVRAMQLQGLQGSLYIRHIICKDVLSLENCD